MPEGGTEGGGFDVVSVAAVAAAASAGLVSCVEAVSAVFLRVVVCADFLAFFCFCAETLEDSCFGACAVTAGAAGSTAGALSTGGALGSTTGEL
ncbi:MAG TPA: hypothetical protein VGL03_15025 [Thermoanaerobaculia bacterium]